MNEVVIFRCGAYKALDCRVRLEAMEANCLKSFLIETLLTGSDKGTLEMILSESSFIDIKPIFYVG